jgi:fructose-bisphosphate aldolase class II/tagatose 1,6-diphosphate aldolase GatY/KbaY
MHAMLEKAYKGGYAIAAYNIIDYLSTKAVIETAESLNAPVITQVSVKTIKFWGYDAIVSWYRQLAEKASIPVALHLDHCKDLEVIQHCIDAGWTSVMIDASSLPFERNVELSVEAREMATRGGVSLEAELGQIGGVEDDISIDEKDAHLADVSKAIEFCDKVSPDLFAPAIGTAHGVYKGEPKIAYDRIDEISKKTGIPIALHGGTGLTDDVFRKCIALGCSKVNISTMLKHGFIKSFIGYNEANPNDYEPIKYLSHQFEYISKDMKKIMTLFGASGKA